MDSKTISEIEEQYGAHNYHPLNVVIERAEGVWVYDIEGQRYLDALSCYSALSHGHCHPRLVRAMIEQLQKLTLTSRAFRNNQLPLLCKELCELTGYEMFLPMNTGAEAVETALKTARKWAYQVKGVPNDQAEVIVCQNNFHGRTITIVTYSTEPLYRNGFGPFTPGFVIIPYGDPKGLESAITSKTAAFLVEPIQGEAGVIVPPQGYLQQAVEICKRQGVLLVVDEIQTGLGRCGKLFACDHEGVHPDVMIVGKALGGGMYPVSGVLSSSEVLGVLMPGMHGSTFGGNPLGAAVAREAIKILVEEGLIENSARLGEHFITKLKVELTKTPNPHVDQIRGKGLLVGVVLKKEAGGARRFCEALMKSGLLCKETHEDVIRFAPPLIIDRETIDWAIERIVGVLNMP